MPALLVALGGLAIPAIASGDDAVVQATINGTVQPPLRLSSLESNPACPTYDSLQGAHYDDHSTAGTFSNPFTADTWPISSILACLDAPTASEVDVYYPASSLRSQLTGPDLAQPSPGGSAPVIIYHGSSSEYHRPPRFDGDNNGDESVPPLSDEPIYISVETGDRFVVTVDAPSSAAPGQRVTFTANATGRDVTGLSYDWSFSDGQPDQRTNPVGIVVTQTVTATVTVRNATGGGVHSATVTVHTDAPTPTPTASPAAPGTATGSNAPAPPGKVKKHNTPPGKTTGSSKDKSASGSKGGGTKPSPTSTPTATSTATPSPSPTPSPTSGSGSGSSSGHGKGSAASRSGAGSKQPVKPSQTPQPAPPDAGLQRVDGQLVSDVIPLSEAASPLVQDVGAPGGSATAERIHEGRSNALPIAGASLAVLLLLALGAAGELGVRWRALVPTAGR